MPKFVVHKKGFSYDDSTYTTSGSNGSIVGIFNSIEDAKIEKAKQDVISLRGIEGFRIHEFVFWDDLGKESLGKLKQFFLEEYNMPSIDLNKLEFPMQINEKQALKLLELLDLSFHDIVEYDDSEIINPDDFKLGYEFESEF